MRATKKCQWSLSLSFRCLFRWRNFGQHLLTSVLPKSNFWSKNGGQNRLNHESTKWLGGIFVLRYYDPIFAPDEVQGMYSTLPKRFRPIWDGLGRSCGRKSRKYRFFCLFWRVFYCFPLVLHHFSAFSMENSIFWVALIWLSDSLKSLPTSKRQYSGFPD